MKTCNKCGVDKPRGDFHIRRASNDGLCPECKDCKRARGQAHHAANREKHNAQGKAWREANPERYREGMRRWRDEDRERYRQSCRDNYQHNREAILARNKEWAENNPERVQEIHKRSRRKHADKVAARGRAYREQHPERFRIYDNNRRARELAAPGEVTPEQWQSVLDYFGHRCAYCGRAGQLSLDHIQALSVGGSHDTENIVPACLTCNSRKWATSLLLCVYRGAFWFDRPTGRFVPSA